MAIEATLRWDLRKQVTMVLPVAQHFSFHIPAAAFANQGYGQQFPVRTVGRRSGTLEDILSIN